jgi:hypothetical protein
MNNGNQQTANERERGIGYNYGNSNNIYTPLNPNDQNQQQNTHSNPYSNNPYLNNVPPGNTNSNPYLPPQNNNYNTTTNENNNRNNNDHQYPQTGLNLSDAERGETRTEFILPENLKLAMILTSICCITCFFILLIVK